MIVWNREQCMKSNIFNFPVWICHWITALKVSRVHTMFPKPRRNGKCCVLDANTSSVRCSPCGNVYQLQRYSCSSNDLNWSVTTSPSSQKSAQNANAQNTVTKMLVSIIGSDCGSNFQCNKRNGKKWWQFRIGAQNHSIYTLTNWICKKMSVKQMVERLHKKLLNIMNS